MCNCRNLTYGFDIVKDGFTRILQYYKAIIFKQFTNIYMMQKTVNGVLTQLLHRLIALFLICVESSGLTSILKIKQNRID